jgi:LuxR family maltose regulon positive regulatory protein
MRPLPVDTVVRERPSASRRLIPRETLLGVLSDVGPGGIVFVCAPPGSGKTVLLRSWAASAASCDRVAWVSVERDEEDARHFWLAVIEALAGAAGEDGLVERVGATPTFRGAAVIDGLVSDLRSLDEPVVLVIDDLHELRSAEAMRLLDRFLARVPPSLRVALATRKDPPLALHRLRLASELREIRGGDLRFSLEETRRLLEADGIELGDDALTSLHERTEGWAAGMRLAALSLARHPEPERFLAEFSGSERTVAAYLMAEVLEREPAEVRDLLLRTSILERVSGPLADHLAGTTGSERILRQLEDANAFVVSLDAARSWFRYHHLFADLLRLELRQTSPTSIVALHRAAARWHEEHGFMVEAVRHAQAAGDWPHAARLLADEAITLVFDGRTATLRALLAAFPDDAGETDPQLALVFAKAGLNDSRLEESATYVAVAERLAATVPEERRRRFALRLAEVRLALARRRLDLGTAREAMRAVEQALAAQSPADLARGNDLRAAALMNLGIAELWALRVCDARGHLEDGLALARRIDRPYLQIGCLGHLAVASVLAGRPASVGMDLGGRAVTIARENGWMEDPVAAAALGGEAILLLWLGRFAEAERRLEQARRALRPDGEPATELIILHGAALLSMARDRFEEALATFEAAERKQALLADQHSFSGEQRSRIAQMQARLGDTVAARATLATMAGEEDDLAGVRIAQAAVHLAEHAPQEAADVLAPVIECRERAVKAEWAAIDASLLDALAREQLGDRRASEASVEHALELAEPEGVILPFVLMGVGELLERHPRHETAHATLLSEVLDVLAGPARPGRPSAPLREELSDAELRVIRYLPSNLKAPEIAAELYVSPNTVRTHLRHIYAKLDAHNRREAVDRARALGLLAPAAHVR